jgi:hypothetical protein
MQQPERGGTFESRLRLLVSRLLLRAGDKLDHLGEILGTNGRVTRTAWQLEALTHGSSPIVVGPWVSEVGFELLYWIPFLNWAAKAYAFDRERLIVVSRGGTHAWYRHLSQHYVEIFDHLTPNEFKVGNEHRIQAHGQVLKHMRFSDLDQHILARIRPSLKLDRLELLHPSLMYERFEPSLRRRGPLHLIERHASFRRLDPLGPDTALDELPASYVAVKFYFNRSFPDTVDNRAFIAKLLERLTTDTDVVLLNTGLMLDDHHESGSEHASRVHTIDHLVTPSNNLDIQTRVISRARAFVGTYGGLSYLAPFYGVDSLAFYSEPGEFVPQHLSLAQKAFQTLGPARFAVLNIRDLELLRLSGVVGPV